MVRGGWLGLLLVLFLVVPSVSATLTMTCPASAQATHPFTISASDPSATNVSLHWQGKWYMSPGTTASGVVTEGADKQYTRQAYDAVSFDSSGNQIDSATCYVYIDSANFPCSASVSPSSLSLSVGQSGWATVSASDADGLRYVFLGSRVASCYNGGYPPSCSQYFSLSYPNAGTYTVQATAKDQWNNPCEEPATLTVTVTDPCQTSPPDCNDNNPCTTDSCVVVNGQATCSHGNVDDGSLCPTGRCLAGNCVAECNTNGDQRCLASQPPNSEQESFYCPSTSCFSCASGFHWSGSSCVADETCQNPCSDGETRCVNSTSNQTCVQDAAGCWEWSAPAPCPTGETCTGGVCSDPCAGVPNQCSQQGATQCSGSNIETCGQWNGQCLTWNVTTCATPTPYCVESGGSATCEECRNDNDCGAGETCVNHQCSTPAQCESASNCTSNPYDPACSSVACTNGACAYNKANDGQSCADGTGVCNNGACVDCINDADCPTGTTCVQHTCVASCTASPGCATHKPNHAHTTTGRCTTGACYTCDNGFPWNGSACVASCQPSCPSDGAGYACGATIPDGCGGTCSIKGTRCTDDKVCTPKGCATPSVTVTPDPASVVVQVGHRFDIAVNATPAPAGLQASGLDAVGGTLSGRDTTWHVAGVPRHLGTYTLTLKAYGVDGTTLGTTDLSVSVTCDETKECCTPGQTNYDEGAPCTTNGNPGICTANGACTRVCLATSQTGCHENAVTYLDSCGHWGSVKAYCNGTCVENTEGATCEATPPTCTGTYTRFCRDNNIWQRDNGCGQTSLAQTCGPGTCTTTGGIAACTTPGPCDNQPGTIACNQQCVNPLTDRLNCGRCDHTCGRNEQCVQGSCQAIPGCVVICDQNSDCGNDMVCVQAGSCTESRCEPVTPVNLTPTEQANLVQEISQKLVTLKVTMDKTGYDFTADNLGPTPLNINVTANFSKIIAAHAGNLAVNGANYTIKQDDPILIFHIPLDQHATWHVDTGRTLDPTYGQLVTTNITYTTPTLNVNQTLKALTIGLHHEYHDNTTTFTLTLNPNQRLTGLHIPIQIPKCLAQYVNQLNLQGHYRVIKDDPLLVWNFNTLNAPAAITFSINKKISDECAGQLKALAYARKINGPVTPWLAVLRESTTT